MPKKPFDMMDAVTWRQALVLAVKPSADLFLHAWGEGRELPRKLLPKSIVWMRFGRMVNRRSPALPYVLLYDISKGGYMLGRRGQLWCLEARAIKSAWLDDLRDMGEISARMPRKLTKSHGCRKLVPVDVADYQLLMDAGHGDAKEGLRTVVTILQTLNQGIISGDVLKMSF